jgi:hypothetical protein
LVSRRAFLRRGDYRKIAFQCRFERECQHGHAGLIRDLENPSAPIQSVEITIGQEVSRCFNGLFFQRLGF